jgi:serine/threonine-protein kinase
LSGQRLGDYRLGDLIGSGGMADVYRSYDSNLRCDVAIKVLPGILAEDPSYAKRFRAEAERASRLSHPHLVPVLRAGEAELSGQHLLYIVMPLLRGSLADVLARAGKLPYAEAVWLTLQVASGLEQAHAASLVHRDVKPENILLDAGGKALLADFGIAREMRLIPGQGVAVSYSGPPMGTPEYMAPEQLRGGSVDQRADQYSLGAVLYEMLTGKAPFGGESQYDLAARALTEPLTPPSTYVPGIPDSVERVVLKALARDPANRYPSVPDFSAALRQSVIQAEQQYTMPYPAAAGSMPPVAVERPDSNAIWPLPDEQPANQGNGLRRRLLAVGLAVLILLASVGLLLSQIQARGGLAGVGGGNPPFSLPGAPTSAAQQVPTARATAPQGQSNTPGAVTTPGQTPGIGVTPGATGTPPARPTDGVTVTPELTQAVVAPFKFSPTPLELKGLLSCQATQTITNTSGSTVGWAWQGPSMSGYQFRIDGGPAVNWPSATTQTPPGGHNTLVVTTGCQLLSSSSYTIHVADTLGNVYAFTMIVD